jgi:hypothetical protein
MLVAIDLLGWYNGGMTGMLPADDRLFDWLKCWVELVEELFG